MKPKKQPQFILDMIDDQFQYDPTTGVVLRYSFKFKTWRECKTVNCNTRYRVCVHYRNLQLTNVCWYLYYKEWPDLEIDHRDLNGFNNKIDNLRKSTYSQNSRHADKRNTNNYHGVSYHAGGKKYRYRFSIEEKRYERYGFVTDIEAALARNKHLDDLGDEFVKRNIIVQ